MSTLISSYEKNKTKILIIMGNKNKRKLSFIERKG